MPTTSRSVRWLLQVIDGLGPPPSLATHLLLWENQKPQEIRNRESTVMSSTLLSWSSSSQWRNVYDVFKNIFVFSFSFGKNQKEDGWRGIINDKPAAPFFLLLLPIVKDEIFEREKGGRRRLISSGKESNAELQMRKCVLVMRKRENSTFLLFCFLSLGFWSTIRTGAQLMSAGHRSAGAPESTAQARSGLDSAKWGGMKLWLNRDYSSFSQFKKK